MQYQLHTFENTNGAENGSSLQAKQLKDLLAWLETPAAAEALGDQWTPGDELVESAKWEANFLLKKVERREGPAMLAAAVDLHHDTQNAHSEFMKSNH